jgi:hypothetical protein
MDTECPLPLSDDDSDISPNVYSSDDGRDVSFAAVDIEKKFHDSMENGSSFTDHSLSLG